jgi:putative hydrolase of the HAD superfamily
MRPPLTHADIDLILFDLDNTLYPRGLALWSEIDRRILAYVCQTLNLPPDEAQAVQKRYWRTYGTTIMGLMAEHNIDPEPYLAFVHDFDARRYLQPNPALTEALAALPQRKAVFTNATAAHARNVLSALGILSLFDRLVGMNDTGYISKPHPLAYERCLTLLEMPAHRCLFIEDSAANLPPARQMGMRTALVGAPDQGEADYYLPRIEDVAGLFAPAHAVSAPPPTAFDGDKPGAL